MAFTVGLYYPWIDIRDSAWLKSASLYWDTIRTIVPKSMAKPYSNRAAQAFADAGVLQPLRVHSTQAQISELTDEVMSYLHSEQGIQFLAGHRHGWRRTRIHVQKLPPKIWQLARLHPDKLSWEVRHIIERLFERKRHGKWYAVDEAFAAFYMTLLATRLSARIRAALLTPYSLSERLANTVRTGATPPPANLRSGLGPDFRRRKRYRREGYGGMDREGMLVDLVLEKIAIDPRISVDTILKFRKEHAAELGRFRTEIARLASSVPSGHEMEATRQAVEDQYKNEVAPAVDELKSALRGSRIRFVCQGLLSVAFLSAVPTSALVTTGLSVPETLLAGAGISLAVSSVLYNTKKAQTLRKSPYSYVLSMQALR